MSKYCQNCYSKIKDEHQFCTQCGTKFEEKVSAVNKEEKNNINQEVLIPSSSHVKFIMWGIVLCIFIFAISNFTIESDQSVLNNEAIKSELSLEEKSILLEEAKKDFKLKNYVSSRDSKIIENKLEQQVIIKKEEKNQIEKKFTIIDSPEMKHKINNFLNGFIYLLTDEKYYSIQYIDDVIYYDWGKTQGYKAHNDKINLIKKWPYLQYSVKSIDSIKQDESGNYIVEFKLNFKSWNFKRKGFQGVAQYKLVITKYMTQILEENSKVLSRGQYNAISNYVNNLPFIGKKRFDDSFGFTNIVELKENGQMKIINGHYRSGGWHVSYEGDFVNFYSKTKILFHSDAVCEEKYNECVPLSDTNENADEYLE